MKPALLTLSFLLFAFPLAFSNNAEPVLDASGDPLLAGSEYYIKPPFWGAGDGRVSLGITGNSRCPVTALFYPGIQGDGIPVRFSIPGVSTGEIFTDTPLEIEFSKKPPCAESSKWKVYFDYDIQKAYVGIGGPEDHPGQEPLNGTFRIQKQKMGQLKYLHKLVFCDTRLPTCFDIGRFNNPPESGMRLVLTDNEPFEVLFKKARSDPGIRAVV